MTNCNCDNEKRIAEIGPEEFTSGLSKLKIDPNDWNILYRCEKCGSLWEKYFPYGERHGGGPTAVRKVTLSQAKEKYEISQ